MDVENHGGCVAVLPRATLCCLVTMPGSLFFMLIKIHWRSSDTFAEMPIVRMPKGRFANTAPFPHRGPWEKRVACYQNGASPVGTGTKVGHEAQFHKY